jgi:lipopolysaccharide transport system permease protein
MKLEEIVISHAQPNSAYWQDLVRFRELLYFFAWRDILVRYKQAVLGIAWALIRPLLNMLLFTFIFGRVANLPSGNTSYALFVLAGMLPWQLYAFSAVDTCNSLVTQTNMISKVYFPRVIMPLSQIIVSLVDFAIGLVLLALLGTILGGFHIATLPAVIPFIMLVTLLAAGTGLWLSALTVRFRDFKLIVPFFVQFSMFLSPVGYGTFVIPEKWRLLYQLNPLVGVIDGFRWSLFGISYPGMGCSIASSVLLSALIAITGFLYFRSMEKNFADQI